MKKYTYEFTRVQIPAILTLVRMGYGYISLKTRNPKHLDKETNIFKDVFLSSLKKINPDVTDEEILSELETISLLLASDDLGKAFYLRLTIYQNNGRTNTSILSKSTYSSFRLQGVEK